MTKKRRAYGRGGISKTSSGKWLASRYVSIRRGDETVRVRRKRCFSSEAAAKRFLKVVLDEDRRAELLHIQNDADEEERIARDRAEDNLYDLPRLVGEWLQSLSVGGTALRPQTITAKRDRLIGRRRPIAEEAEKPPAPDRRPASEYAIFGEERLLTVKDIRLHDVKKFIARRRASGIGDATLKLQLGDARQLLTWGVSEGRLRFNLLDDFYPFRGKKRAKQNTQRSGTFRALTDGELNKLFTHAKPWLRRVLKFLLLTGLRKTELTTLRWGDVRLDEGKHGTIHLKAENLKCGSGQAHANGDTVLLTPESRRVLLAGPEALQAVNGQAPVFRAPRAPRHPEGRDKSVSGPVLLRALHVLAEHAGVKRRTDEGRLCIHAFRVTFCCQIVKQVPLTEAHLMMRHASLAQTVAYLRFSKLHDELAKGWESLTTMLPDEKTTKKREA
jgi:integrase